MLEVSLIDNDSPSLAALPDWLREALSSKMNALAAALQAKVQGKLSGGVLNAKSGALLRSVVVSVDTASADITASLAARGDIKYAAIHEFGGIIPPHEIVPDKAKALAFLIGGKQAFAARVHLPAIAMPERSFMRSSLAEMADEIRDGLSEAAIEAMQ